MTRLFDRRYTLTLGTTQISGLDVSFKITKSTKREPNKASFEIFNLHENTRRMLEQTPSILIQFSAGYVDPGPFLLFRGDCRPIQSGRTGKLESARSGPDICTKIEASDSGTSVLQSRVSSSFPPGTKVIDVLKVLIAALGIGPGNVDDLSATPLENAGLVYPQGTVVSGSAFTELDHIIKSMGLRWSIQNGIFQAQQRGQPLQLTAVLLSRDSGLIGEPEVDSKGVVKAVSLLQPGLDPGRKVSLQSTRISGGYEVIKQECVGDSSAGAKDWYANLELRKY